MKLDIYLNYAGNCQQAFHFYEQHLDRKSTRLNSSHGYISYAVFCLKKKKKSKQKIPSNDQANYIPPITYSHSCQCQITEHLRLTDQRYLKYYIYNSIHCASYTLINS